MLFGLLYEQTGPVYYSLVYGMIPGSQSLWLLELWARHFVRADERFRVM